MALTARCHGQRWSFSVCQSCVGQRDGSCGHCHPREQSPWAGGHGAAAGTGPCLAFVPCHSRMGEGLSHPAHDTRLPRCLDGIFILPSCFLALGLAARQELQCPGKNLLQKCPQAPPATATKKDKWCQT